MMMKSLKNRLKRRYRGLKEFFLDWYHGTDKMSRWYDRYWKEKDILLTPKMQMIIEDVDKATGWEYKTVTDRRTGMTTALSLGAYFESKVRGKEVLVLVANELQQTSYERHFEFFDRIMDKTMKCKRKNGGVRIETIARASTNVLRGTYFETAFIDRHKGSSKWYDAMQNLREIASSRDNVRVIEWNLIAE